MIKIELTEPKILKCECCGGTTKSLTRFVYQDGDAFAIYYATFAENHPEKIVTAVVSIGDWGCDEVPPDRVAFALRLWEQQNNYSVTITDQSESPWKSSRVLGRMLDREEALKHPWIEEVFHITDHMTADDPEIKAFFEDETIH